jgi:peptidoglycan/LPS O-acetylase OafA/YrhL
VDTSLTGEGAPAAGLGGGGRPADRGEAITQAGEHRSTRIESLRAIAALAVVVGHVTAVSLAFNSTVPSINDLGLLEKAAYGGGVGVLFFFALSGYLLFWPFAKHYFGGGDSIDVRRYALNRAVRILPLYYAVVVVVLLLQYPGASLGTWARFLTFTENLSLFTAGRFVGPAWSLVIELQFYVLLPLLAFAVARAARRSRILAAAVLIAVALVSLAVRIHTQYGGPQPDPLWRFSLPTTFLFFVPGMLLALVRLSWEERRPEWVRGRLQNADLWLIASLPLWAVVVLYRYELDPLLGVAAFLIIGACVLPLRAGRLTRSLGWRPLALVGVASYSLYLWHVPVIKALVDSGVPTRFVQLGAISIPVALAVAFASYSLVESPFLRLRRQWARSSAEQEPPQPAAEPVAVAGESAGGPG